MCINIHNLFLFTFLFTNFFNKKGMSIYSDESNLRQIRIGVEFQASLPDYQPQYSRKSTSTLVWAPPLNHIPEITMVTQEFYELGFSRQQVLESIYSQSFDLIGVKRDLRNKLENETQNWTQNDINSFELGLQEFGKNFGLIQSNYLLHKSIPDLIGFYYKWKLNRPISKVDLKLKCYLENQENSVNNPDTLATKPLTNVAWSGSVSDNISVTVDEIKQVLSDTTNSEMKLLDQQSELNLMRIQTNSHSIRKLKYKLENNEIESMRPKSFYATEELISKRININKKRLDHLTTEVVSNGRASPKRVKYGTETENITELEYLL